MEPLSPRVGAMDGAPGALFWLEDSHHIPATSSQPRDARLSAAHTIGAGTSVPLGAGGPSALGYDLAERDARAIFNGASSGAKGVQRLLEGGHLTPDGGAPAVAAFLLSNDGKLDASKVGEYLSGADDVARETAGLVLDSMAFAGLPLDSALRKTISLIKLPGASPATDMYPTQLDRGHCCCQTAVSGRERPTASTVW